MLRELFFNAYLGYLANDPDLEQNSSYECTFIGIKAYQTVRIQAPKILKNFDKQLLSRPAPNLFGQRYEPMDIFLQAFLKVPDVIACRFAQRNSILNDSWTVNLRTTNQPENILMNSFLSGFAANEGQAKVVDATDELTELSRIYNDALKHMQNKEKEALSQLVYSMKRFIEVHEERQKVEQKKSNLDSKLSLGNEDKKPCCQDENEDEEE